MPVLAVARLWFEGNAFSPLPTGQAQFAAREWAAGGAALQAARGTATELAAVCDALDAHPDWRAEILRCASATPGGPIEDEWFESYCAEVLEGLRQAQPDAVYLSLHGAAITPRHPAADLELVSRVRSLLPGVPLAASFDLHGNMPPALCAQLDFATGYRTYPHVDMRETAARALTQLFAIAAGGPRSHGVIVPLGLALPSFNMRTGAGPMAEMEAVARGLEARAGNQLDITLFGGFPYADTPDTGSSVMAWAASAEGACDAADAMAAQWRTRAAEFTPRLVSASEGLADAAALLAAQAPDARRPVAVTDPADNPLSGGAADTPALLRALLAERGRTESPLATLDAGAIVFAYFYDPLLVARAKRAGIGATLDVRLGARLDPRFGAPVEAHARVLRVTDGRFRNSGPMERGSSVSVGATVLLDLDGVQVIVASEVGAANDPGFFTLHGIDLAAVRLLCVKAKNHFRAAFLPLTQAIIDVDCPGPAAADLSTLPRRRT
jgi:microcystin degradation protein MlrC